MIQGTKSLTTLTDPTAKQLLPFQLFEVVHCNANSSLWMSLGHEQTKYNQGPTPQLLAVKNTSNSPTT